VDKESVLKEDNISFTKEGLVVGKMKLPFNEMESIFIGEKNPAKDRAYAYIGIGIVLVIFTSRWFLAGGVLAILAGIVTFFDSRRKYSLIVQMKAEEKVVAVSYDLKRIQMIENCINEKKDA